jgi:hypothetical protein
MPKDMKEPQSYGSDKDWVTGNTGENVNNPKSRPTAKHQEFYDDKREEETSASYQGGKTSPIQLAESSQERGEARSDAGAAAPGVTKEEGGAKRDSFFRKRDYE